MALEATLIEMSRKINSLQTMVNDHNRRLIHAPLHAGPSKVLTIASGVIEATRPYIHLVPESGVTDILDSITNGSDGKVIVISNSRVGDTITINPFSVGGGNIDLNGATAAYDLDNAHESITLIYRESTLHWELVSGGVIPSGSIGAHAPSHQHGGTDEVATSTPGANAIVKADADGKIGVGWIDPADIGAAIHGSPEQTVLEATNRIALTDDGVLKYTNWSTILSTLNDLYVDKTTNQIVGGEKTWQAKAVFEAPVVLSGTDVLGTAPLTIYDNGVTQMAYIVNEMAATYADTTPNAQIVLYSRFTGQVVNWSNARLKWGYSSSFGSSGARFGIDIVDSAGAWLNALTIKPSEFTVDMDFRAQGSSGSFLVSPDAAFGIYASLTATGSQEAVLNLANPTNSWQLWRKPSPDTSLYFFNGTERLILSASGYQFEGNARGKYSSGLDFAFFTGTDVEVMGNAEWNGSAYRRYITGRAAKVTVGDEGWFRVFTNDATDIAANITWGDARLTIDNKGTMAFGTIDIEAWSTAHSAMQLGGSSAIMASNATSGLYIMEGVYYDGLFKYKTSTIPPTLIAMTSSGINFYANAAGVIDAAYTVLHKMNIQPGGVVIGGTVTHNQPLTINHATGASGIEWSHADVAKAYIGVAQTANNWVVGSVANDFVMRAVGGAIIFTVDNGVGRTLKIHTTGLLESRAGGAAVTETITIGGTLFANGAVTSNSGTAETDLKTFTIPASTLRTDGDELVFEDFGTYAANTNNKLISFYVNGTMVHNRLTAANTGTWHVRAVISRYSATTVQVVVTITLNQTGSLAGVSTKYASVATTLSSSFIVKTTGDGDATGDMSSAHASVKYFPFNS